MSWLNALVRPDILALAPYEAAAWESGLTRLNANELPWRARGDSSAAGLNRYPQAQPRALLERLGRLYGVAPESLLACRGSDEAIDLLVRTFCRAGRDAVLICPPTFGMYALAARIQGARVISVPLRRKERYALDVRGVLARCSADVKLVFLCSPNNPTGNLLDAQAVVRVVDTLRRRALVVVDEAYVEFARRASLAALIRRRPQLIVLRTLSKAHGLAGARLGALIAAPPVIDIVRKVQSPFSIAQPTLETVLAALADSRLRATARRIGAIRTQRVRLARALRRLPLVTDVRPSDANFILARFTDAGAALERARTASLLVRDVRAWPGLGDALRITVGTPAENDCLLRALSA